METELEMNKRSMRGLSADGGHQLESVNPSSGATIAWHRRKEPKQPRGFTRVVWVSGDRVCEIMGACVA